jgi:hypothetical protein
MERQRATFGFFGIAVGAAALMLAIVHFWAGPFSPPQQTLEESVAEKAVAIRDATIAALKGEKAEAPPPPPPRGRDLDELTRIATGVLGGLALILGVVSAAAHEPLRVAAGGVFLGGAAMAFQFAILAIGAIFLAILIAGVLGELGFD